MGIKCTVSTIHMSTIFGSSHHCLHLIRTEHLPHCLLPFVYKEMKNEDQSTKFSYQALPPYVGSPRLQGLQTLFLFSYFLYCNCFPIHSIILDILESVVFYLSNIEGFHVKILIFILLLLYNHLLIIKHLQPITRHYPVVNGTQCTVNYLKHLSLCLRVFDTYIN